MLGTYFPCSWNVVLGKLICGSIILIDLGIYCTWECSVAQHCWEKSYNRLKPLTILRIGAETFLERYPLWPCYQVDNNSWRCCQTVGPLNLPNLPFFNWRLHPKTSKFSARQMLLKFLFSVQTPGDFAFCRQQLSSVHVLFSVMLSLFVFFLL